MAKKLTVKQRTAAHQSVIRAMRPVVLAELVGVDVRSLRDWPIRKNTAGDFNAIEAV